MLPNGQSVFRQPDAVHPDGYVLPFRLDTSKTSAQQLHDLSHEWGRNTIASTAERWTAGSPRTARSTAPPVR